MLLAKLAVFHKLYTVRMSLFILCRHIVTLLAFGTCQNNLRTHGFHLRPET